MSDLEAWKIRGPVRTLRIEHADWDSSRGEWQAPRWVTMATFHRDGRLSSTEFHNPNGSMTRSARSYDDNRRLVEEQWWTHDEERTRVLYSYDAEGRKSAAVRMLPDGAATETEICRYDTAGRKTRVQFLSAERTGCVMHYGFEGTDQSYGAPGATTLTTQYEHGDLPSEATFTDSNGAVVRHIVFTRDSSGRLISEVAHFGPADSAFDMDKRPVEKRADIAAVLSQAFADRTLSSTTYTYDEKGRLIERLMKLGTLSEERTTFQYDANDNPLAEDSEDISREVHLDEAGNARTTDEDPVAKHVRFEYEYDAHGNWTTRVVSIAMGLLLVFRRSHVGRRTITYY